VDRKETGRHEQVPGAKTAKIGGFRCIAFQPKTTQFFLCKRKEKRWNKRRGGYPKISLKQQHDNIVCQRARIFTDAEKNQLNQIRQKKELGRPYEEKEKGQSLKHLGTRVPLAIEEKLPRKVKPENASEGKPRREPWKKQEKEGQIAKKGRQIIPSQDETSEQQQRKRESRREKAVWKRGQKMTQGQ